LALALEKKGAPVVESTKYVGLDVQKEATTVAVMNSAGKSIMESIIETKASTIRRFIQGLRGDLHVTFEEGTWASCLYDLLKPYVSKVVVCDPRKNTLLKVGNKSDRIDPKKLSAEWGTSDNNHKVKFYSISERGRKKLSADAAYWQRLSIVMNLMLTVPEEEETKS
jgi:hypothetical protein